MLSFISGQLKEHLPIFPCFKCGHISQCFPVFYNPMIKTIVYKSMKYIVYCTVSVCGFKMGVDGLAIHSSMLSWWGWRQEFEGGKEESLLAAGNLYSSPEVSVLTCINFKDLLRALGDS